MRDAIQGKPMNSMSGEPRLRGLSLLLGAAILACCPTIRAQGTPAACSLQDHVYTCDAAAFHKALVAAKTVSIETHSVDRLAAAQLKSLLLKHLDKSVVPEGSPADLIFLLIPIDSDGVHVGSAASDLGTLRIYSATPDGARQALLWAETYTGQPDIPWPAVVNALIAQFRKRFSIR